MAAPEIIPVSDERLRVEKRVVVSGRVRVQTQTETVEELVAASLSSETVEIRHVPVNREVTEIPKVRVEGDVTIVPVLEEVLLVEKRLVLKEEVHLVRRTQNDFTETTVPVRKQRVVVSRLDRDGQPKDED